jgi:hypothetical protein
MIITITMTVMVEDVMAVYPYACEFMLDVFVLFWK